MSQKEKTYNYFYIINNLLNGHFYLGVHSTDDLDDGYFGSGKVLKQAIKKHGVENFELTILKYFDTRDELMTFEREVVNERFLEYYQSICYNLKKGGEGGSVKQFTDEELKTKHNKFRHDYYIDNKNRRLAYAHSYYEKNKERIRELQRKWAENNRERRLEINRESARRRYCAKKRTQSNQPNV